MYPSTFSLPAVRSLKHVVAPRYFPFSYYLSNSVGLAYILDCAAHILLLLFMLRLSGRWMLTVSTLMLVAAEQTLASVQKLHARIFCESIFRNKRRHKPDTSKWTSGRILSTSVEPISTPAQSTSCQTNRPGYLLATGSQTTPPRCDSTAAQCNIPPPAHSSNCHASLSFVPSSIARSFQLADYLSRISTDNLYRLAQHCRSSATPFQNWQRSWMDCTRHMHHLANDHVVELFFDDVM